MDAETRRYRSERGRAAFDAFWDLSSDDEKTPDPQVIVTDASLNTNADELSDGKTPLSTQVNDNARVTLPSVITRNSPRDSFGLDRVLTPLNIPFDSYEYSPSDSIYSILDSQLNIPTPMPSPNKQNCSNICSGDFCIKHDQNPIHNRPQEKLTDKTSHQNLELKRRCVRNIFNLFPVEPTSKELNSQRPVTPTESLPSATYQPRSTVSVPSSVDEISDDNDDFTTHENEQISQNNPSPSEIIDGSIIIPRGTKRTFKGASEWVDNKRKRLMNHGLEYCTKKGKVVHKKSLGSPCKCRYKCSEKINDQQRLYIFEKFWQLGDRQKQWSYIIKYTNKVKKNRCLNRDTPNNRKYTIKYYLPLADKSEDVQVSTIDVCKTMFLNTLRVSDRIIKTAWEKYDGSTEVERDKRGTHKNHRKVINEDMIKSVIDHVNAFIPIESHYLRKKTTKLYLEGSPTISRMFQLYNEWFNPEKYSSKVNTERQYREIVRKNFNLGIFIPKKDQCNACHAFRNLKSPSDEQKTLYNLHIENKNKARAKKENDKQEANKSSGKIVSAVFDFEKVLNCPHGRVSLLYYKRKLACLNFTVFDMGSKKAVCYMWDETVANRGSNEVSSCLLQFIEANVEKGVEEFRFWSDNCTGQNRNRIVFSLYSYASEKYGVNISHSFLEKGHTQNEGDSVHSTIEKASTFKNIYTPDEWRLLVRWARAPDHEPYTVINMLQDKFYDFKCRIIDRLWQKDSQGSKISWMKVKDVCVTKDDPYKLMFRYDLNAEFRYVMVKNRTRRQAESLLVKAYDKPLPISDVKYKDLLSLCKEGIIPEDYVDFFQKLPTASTKNTMNTDVTDEFESESGDSDVFEG